MYEVTLHKGTQTVAGFDNITSWSQVRDTVRGLESRYDLIGYDTRCTVRFTDSVRTAIGWATDSATMERPFLVEGFLESGDGYQSLVWDTEQAEAVADSLSFSRVYDLTTEHYDVFPAYLGGWDRDMSRLIVESVTGKVLPC